MEELDYYDYFIPSTNNASCTVFSVLAHQNLKFIWEEEQQNHKSTMATVTDTEMLLH
jgi:hypothetical protein